jgi:hypothetical protein
MWRRLTTYLGLYGNSTAYGGLQHLTTLAMYEEMDIDLDMHTFLIRKGWSTYSITHYTMKESQSED